MAEHRGLASGRPGGPHRGEEAEPALVLEADPGASCVWRFFYPGPVVLHPAGDRLVVTFDGPAGRTLAAPAHLAQDSPHVPWVIRHAGLGFDHLGHTLRASTCRSGNRWPAGPSRADAQLASDRTPQAVAGVPPDQPRAGPRSRRPASRHASGSHSGVIPPAREPPRPGSFPGETGVGMEYSLGLANIGARQRAGRSPAR